MLDDKNSISKIYNDIRPSSLMMLRLSGSELRSKDWRSLE